MSSPLKYYRYQNKNDIHIIFSVLSEIFLLENCSPANDSSSHQVDSYTPVSEHRGKSLFGLKALKGDSGAATTTTVHESRTVHQKVSEQKGGVDQLITDHKGKPLFGLKALQSIGKSDEEPIYEDMPEPPVSPQLKELVLRHENHASKINRHPSSRFSKIHFICPIF